METSHPTLTSQQLGARMDAAMGRIPCDLVLKNVQYLDVFTLEWRAGDIAVYDGVIVGIEPGLKAKREIQGRGKHLVPGFIDAHVHIESSLLIPTNFQKAVLPRGTTSAICDPHELANVQGPSGIKYFLDQSAALAMDLRVMMSSCVPATHLETNGGGTISAPQLLELAKHPQALGLAEMMNVPGVLHGDESILEKLTAFANTPRDGHCPLLRGQALSAYASAGISSCHESSELEEAREKLTKGISIWIREGSVAKDLAALIPLLNVATSSSIGFCTDDRNPLDIARQGHIDYLVRESIRLGIPAPVAYRSSAWSVARHYGLNDQGAIAPGYRADLVLLNDVNTCAISDVFVRGVSHQEIQAASSSLAPPPNSIHAKLPEINDLKTHTGQVHVIGVRAGRILTDHHIMASDAPGVAHLSVLERYGHGSKPANAYVSGFGKNFNGAIASSVGHDSHNICVVGSNLKDMRVALGALTECGGGFVVVHNGTVAERLELPFGGLMSQLDPSQIQDRLTKLHTASQAIGCELPEPFLQLAFLSLPVIPSLKLTDRGLVDVEKFEIIDVRAT